MRFNCTPIKAIVIVMNGRWVCNLAAQQALARTAALPWRVPTCSQEGGGPDCRQPALKSNTISNFLGLKNSMCASQSVQFSDCWTFLASSVLRHFTLKYTLFSISARHVSRQAHKNRPDFKSLKVSSSCSESPWIHH